MWGPAACDCAYFVLVLVGFPPWSVAQRAAAPVRNGAKLLGVGFCASMLGVGITNALIWLRSVINPEQTIDNSQAQNPLVVSSAYATYMATSSNMRYQFLAGVLEERGVEVRNTACVRTTAVIPTKLQQLSPITAGLHHHGRLDVKCFVCLTVTSSTICRQYLLETGTSARLSHLCSGHPTRSWVL
jgi:hypothetical protein